MDCTTSYKLDEFGKQIITQKKAYDTLDEAIAAAKKLNLSKDVTQKVVAYKCKACCKYHIGRNGKTITDKYKEKLSKNIWDNKIRKTSFKIIGKINL